MRRCSPVWAVVLSAGACVESTGPGTLTDPAGVRSSLDAIDTVFTSPVARSAGAFLYGLPIPRPVGGAPLIPDSLLGKTLAFSCDSQRYVLTAQTGAPPHAVRLTLYQLASVGSILCPATAIGQLDLTDASTGDTTAVHATATGVGDGAAYLDYTIRHATADPPFAATAVGWVSDGQQRVDFQGAGHYAAALHSGITVIQLDDSAADAHATLNDSGYMGVDTWSEDVDLTFRHGGVTLGLSGAESWANTFMSWDEIVRVNSVPFAKVGGTAVPEGGQPTLTPLTLPVPFTGEERLLVLDLVAAPGTLRLDLARSLSAGAHLVGIAL